MALMLNKVGHFESGTLEIHGSCKIAVLEPDLMSFLGPHLVFSMVKQIFFQVEVFLKESFQG